MHRNCYITCSHLTPLRHRSHLYSMHILGGTKVGGSASLKIKYLMYETFDFRLRISRSLIIAAQRSLPQFTR